MDVLPVVVTRAQLVTKHHQLMTSQINDDTEAEHLVSVVAMCVEALQKYM